MLEFVPDNDSGTTTTSGLETYLTVVASISARAREQKLSIGYAIPSASKRVVEFRDLRASVLEHVIARSDLIGILAPGYPAGEKQQKEVAALVHARKAAGHSVPEVVSVVSLKEHNPRVGRYLVSHLPPAATSQKPVSGAYYVRSYHTESVYLLGLVPEPHSLQMPAAGDLADAAIANQFETTSEDAVLLRAVREMKARSAACTTVALGKAFNKELVCLECAEPRLNGMAFAPRGMTEVRKSASVAEKRYRKLGGSYLTLLDDFSALHQLDEE
jgi:hypothetical protein